MSEIEKRLLDGEKINSYEFFMYYINNYKNLYNITEIENSSNTITIEFSNENNCIFDKITIENHNILSKYRQEFNHYTISYNINDKSIRFFINDILIYRSGASTLNVFIDTCNGDAYCNFKLLSNDLKRIQKLLSAYDKYNLVFQKLIDNKISSNSIDFKNLKKLVDSNKAKDLPIDELIFEINGKTDAEYQEFLTNKKIVSKNNKLSKTSKATSSVKEKGLRSKTSHPSYKYTSNVKFDDQFNDLQSSVEAEVINEFNTSIANELYNYPITSNNNEIGRKEITEFLDTEYKKIQNGFHPSGWHTIK